MKKKLPRRCAEESDIIKTGKVRIPSVTTNANPTTQATQAAVALLSAAKIRQSAQRKKGNSKKRT